MSLPDSVRDASLWERLTAWVGVHPTLGNTAVLGAIGVGKTTFWDAFQGRPPREVAEPTVVVDDSGKTVAFGEEGAKVVARIMSDVPGLSRGDRDPTLRSAWERIFTKADTVIYVMHAPRVMGRSRDTKDVEITAAQRSALEIDGHLKQFAAWQARKPGRLLLGSKHVPRMLLVASWCDRLPEDDWRARELDLIEELCGRPALQESLDELRRSSIEPQIIMGSLAASERDGLLAQARRKLGT